MPINISASNHHCRVVILLTEIKPLIDSNGKVYTRDAIKPIMNKAAEKSSSFQEDSVNSLAEQWKSKNYSESDKSNYRLWKLVDMFSKH